MAELTSGVSGFGVIAGAVAAFVAGWIWYLPGLFGRGWAAGTGVELGAAPAPPVGALVSQLVSLLLVSWFVGVMAVAETLATTILAAVAFTALAYSGGLFAKKSAYARNVEAGYWLVAVALMIGCQALF